MDPTRRETSAGAAFEAFVALIARLRGPGGCPWDREQTHASLKPMTIEEAYEVLEAIDEGGDRELAGELGDLLLQVVFHSQIAAEEQRFTVADVIAHVSEKMVRRHPHVFGDAKREEFLATDMWGGSRRRRRPNAAALTPARASATCRLPFPR
jgi:MazG family protein